ncbi:MAG TPA: alpha/beta fold hydrolase [Acidimicrobiales bacterium]|nr:alpha/beta fold hydrolase [Acidimicrobiales bacterium]
MSGRIGLAKVRRVEGAGLSLAVNEWGDPAKPTAVLLHGYPDTSEVWRPVAEQLAGRYHVVTYDMRGAGASDAPGHRDGYRLALLIDDLEAVLEAVTPRSSERAVHVVGHDWGSIQGWEAVTCGQLNGRIASYTSISGPPLDHAGQWARQRVRHAQFGVLAGQAARSSYIAVFHSPGVAAASARLAGRISAHRGRWARRIEVSEGVTHDERWPAATFGRDLANGMGLYRANVRARLRRPHGRVADVPVQLIVPTKDPFVPPSLLDGLERWAPGMRQRTISAGHWVIRSHPSQVADWIGQFVDEVEGGVVRRTAPV